MRKIVWLVIFLTVLDQAFFVLGLVISRSNQGKIHIAPIRGDPWRKNLKVSFWNSKVQEKALNNRERRLQLKQPSKLKARKLPPKVEQDFEPPKPPEMELPKMPELPGGIEIPDMAELLQKLMGGGPKGNKISDMFGGKINVQLGKQGAPIYIDQSPSYIFHDPKTEYNQNGVRIPLSQTSAIATHPNSQDLISTNFIRPRRLNSDPTIIVSDDQNKFVARGLQMRTVGLQNMVPISQTGISAEPGGMNLQAALEDVYPENTAFQTEGEQQLGSAMQSAHQFEKALSLITEIKKEIEDVEGTMKQNNDHIDTIINRLFDIKFS